MSRGSCKITKIDWNWAGWNQVRKSPEMQSLLMEAAQQIASNAGEGYEAKQYPSRVIVVPETAEAEADNLKNNTLLKSGR